MFDPLSFSPKHIVLVPTAVFQVSIFVCTIIYTCTAVEIMSQCHQRTLSISLLQIDSSGGPLPQTAIDYSISNMSVASVDAAGLVRAITPGTAVVTGQSHDSSVMSCVFHTQGHLIIACLCVTL